VKEQLRQGVGIFSCDEWSLLSDTEIDMGAGVRTSAIATRPSMRRGASTHSQPFHQVFRRVHEDVRWKHADLIVKVDPDTVFFPSRLRAHLAGIAGLRSKATFFANCAAPIRAPMAVQAWQQAASRDVQVSHFMYGPLEVYTHAAINAFFNGGHEQCRGELREKDTMQEDGYMTRCLELLGVKMSPGLRLGLLRDAHCDHGQGPAPCVDDSVAFHNFSSIQGYFDCHLQAMRYEHIFAMAKKRLL